MEKVRRAVEMETVLFDYFLAPLSYVFGTGFCRLQNRPYFSVGLRNARGVEMKGLKRV